MLQISSCRAIHKEFPDGGVKYGRHKDAAAAGLVGKSSAMEAAYACSQFEGELRAQILELLSHRNLANAFLYKEAPAVSCVCVHARVSVCDWNAGYLGRKYGLLLGNDFFSDHSTRI